MPLSGLSAAESLLHTEISNAKTAFESSLVEAFALSKNSRIYNYIRSFSKSGDIPAVLQYQSKSLTSAINPNHLPLLLTRQMLLMTFFTQSSTHVGLMLLWQIYHIQITLCVPSLSLRRIHMLFSPL